MEEECGNLERSLTILRKGARTSNYNEVLLTKAIKQHERMNNLSGAREMLGRLKAEAIDVTWRTVLEGALLEARAGNIVVARRFLFALMGKVPWYGPIYHEAFRLEEKAELFDRAISVVKAGLKELPRYGPLWFGMMRVMERRDMVDEANNWTKGDVEPKLVRTRKECQKAVCCISRELVWKVHFEQAQTEERAAEIVALARHLKSGRGLLQCRDDLFAQPRECFAKSLLSCPGNLRWKVFLAGARMELSAGKVEVAKALLRQARYEVPEKSRYHVYLECSKLEEYLGNVNAARKILLAARKDIKNEWKLYLEAVLVEARAGNVVGAVYLADKALKMDSGSGRLWALLVQLVHRVEWQSHGAKILRSNYVIPADLNSTEFAEIIPPPNYKVPSKRGVLSRALQVVPKSGEVWCEGARTLLNPLSGENFDLIKAQKYLSFAIQFTPQYGDSFVEYVRLEMLMQVVLPRVLDLMGVSWTVFFKCVEALDPESDSHWVFNEQTGSASEQDGIVKDVAYIGAPPGVNKITTTTQSTILDNMKKAANAVLDIGHCTEAYKQVQLDRLQRRYADT
jgi:tetratricopeptide (TPR) repeat protein